MSMVEINKQTPGPLGAFIDTDNETYAPDPRDAAVIDDGGRVIAEIRWLGDDNETLARMELFRASYTAFDAAGRTLGIDAATLAQRIDIVELISALRRLKHAAFSRQVTMGDPCDLLTAKAELDDEIRHADTVLAKLRGEELLPNPMNDDLASEIVSDRPSGLES